MSTRALAIGILALMVFSVMATGAHSSSGYINRTLEKSSNFKQIAETNGLRYTTHDVIRINNNSDFREHAVAEGWQGNGTQCNPYIISGYDIVAYGAETAIYIGNTTVHFVVEKCYLHNAFYHYDSYFDGSGITLYNVKNGDIYNNTCSGNWNDGIELRYSSGNTIYNNIVNSNDGSGGIFLYYSNNNKIYNNTAFYNGYGITIDFHSSNNTISPNTCNNNIYGINIESYSSNNTISHNACNNNTVVGIHLYFYGNNNSISNNIAAYNSFGFYMVFSSNNIISHNTCNNDGNGIFMVSSSNNTLYSNTVNSSKDGSGIKMKSSTNNKLYNNAILHNEFGIQLLASNKNVIVNNLISNNANYGIYIGSGSHNLIYKNAFFYNHGSGDTYNSSHIQACDNGTNNYWNSATGIGNYWQDWANNNNTNDKNHDEIVDWAYKIAGSAGAEDYYPLKNISVNASKLQNFWMRVIVGLLVAGIAIALAVLVITWKRERAHN